MVCVLPIPVNTRLNVKARLDELFLISRRSFRQLFFKDDPNFLQVLRANHFRYRQTVFCIQQKKKWRKFCTVYIFRFRPLGQDIGDFRGNPAKFEFGAKILKSDFYSLDGLKQPKTVRKVYSRPRTHHRTSLSVIDRRIRKIAH